MKENIRRRLLTSNQRMWDRYAASTDSTNCFKEIERCRWDAILLGGTWRPEEVWESKSGHIFMGACFNQKHGVRILFNTKMEAKDHKNRMCQRKHQPRRIVLIGVCFHHAGYSDVHIEKMHTCVETWKTYYDHRGWFQRPTCWTWEQVHKTNHAAAAPNARKQKRRDNWSITTVYICGSSKNRRR